MDIPLLDCPFDYLIGDASGKVMNEYGRFPCKIKCGVYAFLARGTAKATLNITTYEFHKGDFVLLEPERFLLIHEFSDDALVYYILFSSEFMEKNSYAFLSLDQLQLHSPIIHVKDDVAQLITHTVQVLVEATNCEPNCLSTPKMVNIFTLIQTSLKEYAQAQDNTLIARPLDRKTEIYQLYQKLVMSHYKEWHQVARYAEEMRLTLPHLCATIKQASGRTAGDLICDALLTDAKAQLKITNLQIKEIAHSLGFENVAFFNRFFKTHTGMTPKEYRFS